MIKKSILLVAISFMMTACGVSTYNADYHASKQELQEDLDLLRTALEEAHPGLYHYSDKAGLDAEFDRVAHTLKPDDMTELEFYRHIAPLLDSIQCGHTNIVPSESYEQQWLKQGTAFPFDIKVLDEKVYLIRNYSQDASILPGFRLTAINGVPMNDLLHELLRSLPSDGANQTMKYWRLETAFPRAYAALIGEPEMFVVTGIAFDTGENMTFQVPAIPAHRWQERHHQDETLFAKPVLDLQILPDSATAVLSIASFAVQEGEFYPFLKDAFARLSAENVQYLVIDLRGNTGGGDEYGGALFAYLTDVPFRYYDSITVKTDRLSFRKHTDATWLQSVLYPKMFISTDGGGLQLKPEYHGNLGLVQPRTPHFDGNIYVLIDGGTFSTSAEFCAIAHFQQRAIFIGQETGGGYYGNTSGAITIVTLPNTGVRLQLPLWKYNMAVSDYAYTDRGIMPDYDVEPSLNDILDGVDSVMAFIVTHIELQ